MTAVEIAQVDSAAARALTDRIKVAVEGTWHLITEAYQSRAWSALGYSSWDDYCTREFGQSRLRLPREERTETVQSLRSAGLSLRAIAAATGDSHETVRQALTPVKNLTPDEPVTVVVDHGTGEVLDGEPACAAEVLADLVGPEPITAGEQHPTVVEPVKITGVDGKTYKTVKPANRKPLTDAAIAAGFELRKAMERVERIVTDDRYRTNVEQVAHALRGHLLYVADTVTAVLDQLPTA